LNTIKIVEYQLEHQPGIDEMMRGIQEEYAELITTERSIKLYEAYKLPNQKYWVALHGDRVVGTVGLILISNHNAVLKRMMADKEYRGRETQLGKRLLATTIEWAKKNGTRTIYLGTMGQFKAAQKFYLNQGCVEVPLESLPEDMPVNTMDSIHYKLEIR